MSLRDFAPRPNGAPFESVEFQQWIDSLSTRQNIDLQNELTALAVGDEFGVLDISETSAFKFKKITVSNLKSGMYPGLSDSATMTVLTLSNSTIQVGTDGSAPALVLEAMDGTNEGGELRFMGAGAYDNWTVDLYQNTMRFLTTGSGGMSTPAITSSGDIVATNLTAWSSWTPTRTGWTDVGAPTVTARKCQVRNVGYFQVKIVPATSTATVAGTSYIDLPYTAGASSFCGDGSMQNATTLISVGACTIDVANSRCYVPTQGATANTLLIAGWFEV